MNKMGRMGKKPLEKFTGMDRMNRMRKKPLEKFTVMNRMRGRPNYN